MIRQIRMLLPILMLAATLTLSGCTAGWSGRAGQAPREPSAGDPAPVSLTIGMMASADVIPYVLIQELQLDQTYNIQLQLEVFMSAMDRDAAFQAGELDGVLTDYIGVTMYHQAGFEVKITGITDGDYILLAGKHTGIETIDQIAGQSIAISQNTLIDYSLDYILKEAGLDPDSVEREVVARIPDRLELLRNGQIDLGLMPEPFATLALSSGAVYLKSANDAGLYPAVSAFSQEALDQKEDAIRRLYLAYDQAVDYMNATPLAEYEAQVIKAVRYPEEMAGQITVKPFRSSRLPDREAVEKAIAWSAGRGLTRPDLTYEEITYNIYR